MCHIEIIRWGVFLRGILLECGWRDKTNLERFKFGILKIWILIVKLKTQDFRSLITTTTTTTTTTTISHILARLPHRSSCFLWKCWLQHMLRHIQSYRKQRVSRTKVVFFFFSAKVYVFSRIYMCAELRPQPNILHSSWTTSRTSRFVSSRIQ